MDKEMQGKVNPSFSSEENETASVETSESDTQQFETNEATKQTFSNQTKNKDCSLISVTNIDSDFREVSKLMRPQVALSSEQQTCDVFKHWKPLIKYASSFSLILLSIWALLYAFWEEYAFPWDGPLFSLFVLEISALTLGHIGMLASFPPMTGMITAGIILRNVPCINIAENLPLEISSPLRGISVVILLTRGAFSVNFENIKKYKNVVPFLAMAPCLMEALFGATAAYFIIGFPLPWAALFGCIMSAMSGAGVIPYLNKIEASCSDLQRNDVISIAKTACGLDAIIAICMAECALGFIFSDGEWETGLIKGLLQVLLGFIFGICWGLAAGILLTDEIHSDFKILAFFSGGVFSLLGLYKLGYPRSGPAGVYFGSLASITLWKRQGSKHLSKLTNAYDKLWLIIRPLLFGIIGARTDFWTVDWGIIYKGAIVLGISILARVVATYLSTSWSGLEPKERAFLVVGWCGKGTVAAALGPVALDTALDFGYQNSQLLATQIMNLAVMVILIASTLGFLPLKIYGCRILSFNRKAINDLA